MAIMDPGRGLVLVGLAGGGGKASRVIFWQH